MGIPSGVRLRANPAYELVLLDRLRPAERDLVEESGEGEDIYGLLRPRPGSSLEPRTASPDTALLFLALAQPGPPPSYVRSRLGGDLDGTLGRLVLDEVLELEQPNGFVAGAAAAPLLLGQDSAGGRGRIGELSLAALRYGQELGGLDEPLVAMRLYLYGRLPVSAELRRRWPDEAGVASHLAILSGGRAYAALERSWVAMAERDGAAHWRSWRPRRAAGARSAEAANYKLYVSPAPEALPGALAAVAETLGEAPGLSAFKIGRDVRGICRPDKLVVYFDRLEDLHQAADRLRDQLAGCPAHGVPFSAPVTPDGLLSWGADPPRGEREERSGSWRLWIAERLAEYLAVARRGSHGDIEPWRFALERLRLAGVDTDTWAPTSGIWSAAGVGA